jgi:hypothetical protein
VSKERKIRDLLHPLNQERELILSKKFRFLFFFLLVDSSSILCI